MPSLVATGLSHVHSIDYPDFISDEEKGGDQASSDGGDCRSNNAMPEDLVPIMPRLLIIHATSLLFIEVDPNSMISTWQPLCIIIRGLTADAAFLPDLVNYGIDPPRRCSTMKAITPAPLYH